MFLKAIKFITSLFISMLLGCTGEDFPKPSNLPLPDLTIIAASVSPTSASPGSSINFSSVLLRTLETVKPGTVRINFIRHLSETLHQLI